jgi:O-antigen/teichoic acid export membrane protein
MLRLRRQQHGPPGSSEDGALLVPTSSFARSGTLMFVGNTLAGVFVYALQIVMGRMLRVDDYSLFTALMGVFNITALPLTALLLVVTRSIAVNVGAGDLGAATAVRRQAAWQLAVFGGPAVLVALALSSPIATALGSASVLAVAIMWVAVGANLFTALGAATLQGMHRFRELAIAGAGVGALRLAFCAGLVAVGLGVTGSMLGLLCSLVAGGAIYSLSVRKGLPRRLSDDSRRPLFGSREAALLATSNLAFIALTQFDYIIARVFCSPAQASLYAAGAVLAKSVLWLPVGIAIAVFPTVASHQARGERSRHVLVQALLMATVTSGLLAGVLAIGADFWIKLLYGPSYAGAAVYLRALSLIYLPLALVLVVDNYQLALGRARFIALYALGAACEVLAFLLPGGTPARLVWVLAVASAMCFAWGTWIVVSGSRTASTAAQSA